MSESLEVVVYQRLKMDNALGRASLETALVRALVLARELPCLPVAKHERIPGRDQALHALPRDL